MSHRGSGCLLSRGSMRSSAQLQCCGAASAPALEAETKQCQCGRARMQERSLACQHVQFHAGSGTCQVGQCSGLQLLKPRAQIPEHVCDCCDARQVVVDCQVPQHAQLVVRADVTFLARSEVEPKQFHHPVVDIAEWRAARLIGELRAEKGVLVPNNKDCGRPAHGAEKRGPCVLRRSRQCLCTCGGKRL